MSLRNFENASLMGKALKRLKDIKGQPTMVHEIVDNIVTIQLKMNTCKAPVKNVGSTILSLKMMEIQVKKTV